MASRLLIVDDYWAIRTALKAMLSTNGIDVCGEAENGAEAVNQVRKLHPDLVVLDIDMPVLDGVRAAEQIRHIAPATKILFFSNHDSAAASAALDHLGDAYVPKSAAGTKLIPAVTRLLRAGEDRKPDAAAGRTANAAEGETRQIPSRRFIAVSVVTIAAAVILAKSGRKQLASLVGAWAPTMLALNLYTKAAQIAQQLPHAAKLTSRARTAH